MKWQLAPELSSRSAFKALILAAAAELFCTAAFVFVGTASITSGCHTRDTASASGATDPSLVNEPPGACFLLSANVINIAFAFGAILFVLVYCVASISGAHFNPAITIPMFLTGKISLLRAVVYVLLQVAGACVASGILNGLDPEGFKAALGGATTLNTFVTPGEALGYELILTCIFVFVVFTATDGRRAGPSATPYFLPSPYLSTFGPLSIGFVVLIAMVVAVPIDGASLNPARSFGPAAVANHWNYHWIFWVGPSVGGTVAGFCYEIFVGWAYEGYNPITGNGPKSEEEEEDHQKQRDHAPAGPQNGHNAAHIVTVHG